MSTHVPMQSDPAGPGNTFPAGWSDRHDGRPRARTASALRRRRLPYLLVGVLLILGCTAGGVVVATRIGDQEPVLVLTHAVSVGQVLSAEDLREDSVSAGNSLEFIPVKPRAEAVGHPVAYSLPAGTPLTRNLLG